MTLTPMMQQFLRIKEQYPDCVLFFRLGDFYEMFFDDAVLASRVLEITLTSRDGGSQRVPMCGVPHHSVNSYIAKMISHGYKVAMCDQVEDPKVAKGIVKREVTRVITPGTVIDGQLLEDKQNNYIAAVFSDQRGFGIAFADISTGEFMITEISGANGSETLLEELGRIQPAELLLPDILEEDKIIFSIKNICSPLISFYTPRIVDENKYIYQQFGQENLESLGLPNHANCLRAANELLNFLHNTQMRSLSHIRKIEYFSTNQYMMLDTSARRNLELTKTLLHGEKKGSLLWVLDHTATAMGGRMLKKWIEQPLLDIKSINARLDGVEQFTKDIFLREDLKQLLSQVYDLERLTTRVAYGTANARDLISLKNSLSVLPKIKSLLINNQAMLLCKSAAEIDTLDDLVELLETGLKDDPPVGIREGEIIKEGYSQEVDTLRKASTDGRKWLAQLESKERQRTGIKSLKIGFNKVFGYYIEVTKSNINAVPEEYQRRQTLANAERYITPQLKEYEEMILGAQDKLVELEYQLFIQIRDSVAREISRIQKSAEAVSKIDVMVSLAEIAVKYNYVRPQVNDSGKIHIKEGRHPVVELSLEDGQFVPNDTLMDNDGNTLLLITGPNMGGKSTYQRQVALITLMAQMGSFVPASEAEIGVTDRIFARVGASDDLASGKSTFMMEMHECKNALKNATKNSLVIIDELGRGTSNLEGMAIAQAVIEYLHDEIGCRTLFSTHYHELAEMESNLSNFKNYAAAVEEKGDNVVFLHRIVPGRASKSYGVHCARLAGLPMVVVDRANRLLVDLEIYRQAAEEVISGGSQTATAKEEVQTQLFCCSPEAAELLDEISELDLLNTTPLEALNQLFIIQKKIRNIKQ